MDEIMHKVVKLGVFLDFLLILLAILMGLNAVVLTTKYLKAKPEALDSIPVVEDTVPNFMNKPPQEGLMKALVHYEVAHPEIVYAQAVLETGHFKSDLCLNDNNLFGLYNSKRGKYHKFDHWTESVIAYKDFIQYRYKPPEDYYKFLQRIGYAEDSNYISKLKGIVNKNDTRRSK